MTELTPPPARGEVEAFIGQAVTIAVTDRSTACSGVLVVGGRKLGLCQPRAERGAHAGVPIC